MSAASSRTVAIAFAPSDQRFVVILTDSVITHFDRYRQRSPRSREAGGQLFARIGRDLVFVEKATGPRRSDRRSRWSFRPKRYAEQGEIRRFFDIGLHFVGDWHTHPEPHPRPSPLDIESSCEMFRRSKHELDAFFMVIVGTASDTPGLFVSAVQTQGLRELNPVRDHAEFAIL